MSDRRRRLRWTLTLACVVAWILPLVGQADGASVEDIVQAVHSFQQLAVLDPVTAGDIWMEGRTASDWKRFVERSVDDLFEASVVFGHVIPFAGTSEDGAHAGLYNPWTGSLLVFTYDPLASVIESFAFYAADRLEGAWEDPERLALAAMAAIDAASAQFDMAAGGDTLSGKMSERDLEDAIDQTTPGLASAYGLIEAPSTAQTNVEIAIDLVFADELAFPLDLLDDMPTIWRSTLLPVWIAETNAATVVVLGSPAAPIDWVWLEISAEATDQPIVSASLVQLYDSVVTRGGEDS